MKIWPQYKADSMGRGGYSQRMVNSWYLFPPPRCPPSQESRGAQAAELKGIEWTHGFSAELCPRHGLSDLWY